ncbi:MAG: Na+/H+ antiporter subunit E [Pseudobacteriovorax sp.]|nr:Na+/H+ antiporter subunit E [Pseudobacteriovorax sp.]
MARGFKRLKLFKLLRFLFLYIKDIVVSAIRIAWDVVTIDKLSSPGVFKFPLKATTDLEITIVANLITFSPGSMVIGIDENRKYLLIHSMFLEDEKEAIKNIKNTLERRVLEVIR